MKKRVLQFIGSFHQGGSERQAVSLTRMLSEEGSFDVRVATLNNEGVLRHEVDALGLPEIAEFKLTSFYDTNFLRQVRRCARYLRENEIDLVHTHDFYTNVFGMAAATLAGVPVRIASKRETGAMRSGGQEFVEKIAFGRAHATVANSSAVRNHLVERGIPGGKINVIYNGIDVARFCEGPDGSAALFAEKLCFSEPRPERLAAMPPALMANGGVAAESVVPSTVKQASPQIGRQSRGERLITLVANLRHRVKNVPMLLRAAKPVGECRDDVRFVVAGEGELRDELQGLAVRLGIARKVDFIGRCDDVPSLLARSYACVLTSTAEGFSNSLVEYMAAGKPVVATNVGGAAEAIADGETGFLVDSDDDKTMATRLIDLLDHPQKAQEFGAAGKEVVEQRFSQASQLEKTLDLYNALLHDA